VAPKVVVPVMVLSIFCNGTFLDWRRNQMNWQLNREELAQLIERFLAGKSRYPQEWNDFVETSQSDREIESFRKRIYELDPLVNRPGEMDHSAVAKLKAIIRELRSL
jgi:hypothetical protein